MNKENFDMLKGVLQTLGFTNDPDLLPQLEDELSQDQFSFQLSTKTSFDNLTSIQAILYFYRPSREAYTRLEMYDCRLTYLSEPSKSRFQTFDIDNGTGITFREAFNLLQGRSVYKNLPGGNNDRLPVWIQLDFDRQDDHDNYLFRRFRLGNAYSLEKVLGLYPIAELNDEHAKERLIASLQKGDLLVVTFETSRPKKMYISANPRYKNINVYPAPSGSIKAKFNHKYKSNRPRY
jgi:hypothetical protein